MCHNTREPTVLSRVSCRPAPEFLNIYTSLACYPGAPLTAHRNTAGCWAGIGEDCRPRATWRPTYPFWAARLFLLCVSLEVFATPTRRYHGRMLIHPSPPACATPKPKRVISHTQVRGPLRVRRRLLSACLGDPHPPGHR